MRGGHQLQYSLKTSGIFIPYKSTHLLRRYLDPQTKVEVSPITFLEGMWIHREQ